MSTPKKAVTFVTKEDNGSITVGEIPDPDAPTADALTAALQPPKRPSERWSSPSAPADPSSLLEESLPPGAVEEITHRPELECPVCIVKLKKLLERGFHLIMSEVGLIIILVIYSFIGAAAFVAIEGRAEDKGIADYEKQREDYASGRQEFLYAILNLTRDGQSSGNNFTDDLQKFLSKYEVFQVEETNSTFDSRKPIKQWTWYGALFYCGTVYTTVGYGNIVPVTREGRVVTMIYAALGIPLCLVVLSKLGKTLTRVIKFLWSFVRRFYYTGSCFRIRKKSGWRKLSLGEKVRLRLSRRGNRLTRKALDQMFVPYDVDDKFNLPPAIALIIAFLYIFFGAFMYTRWENWSFLEAFYFTFTSLATIGFGDILPSHPKFFIASGAYIFIGLSLIAMVINVVMEAVSETITKATDQVMAVGNRVKGVGDRIIRVTPVGRLMKSSTPPRQVATEVPEDAKPCKTVTTKPQNSMRRFSM